MRKLGMSMLLVVLAAGIATANLTFTDDFNEPGRTTLGANWNVVRDTIPDGDPYVDNATMRGSPITTTTGGQFIALAGPALGGNDFTVSVNGWSPNNYPTFGIAIGIDNVNWFCVEASAYTPYCNFIGRETGDGRPDGQGYIPTVENKTGTIPAMTSPDTLFTLSYVSGALSFTVTDGTDTLTADITDARVLALCDSASGYGGVGVVSSNWSVRDARFDNFSVDVVPEPVTLACLAVGGLVTMLRRRRRGA